MEAVEQATAQSNVQEEDLSSKSSEELQSVIDRCRRLLAQPLVLARLPGKEQELRLRLIAYEQESHSRPSLAKSECDRSTDAPLGAMRDEDPTKFQREIGEKYRHHRTDLEAEMRRSFSTLLSEAEIKRRIAEIPHPATFLMTFDETMKMERESLARERQRELQRIRHRREVAMREEESRQRSAAATAHRQAHDDHVAQQVFGPE